MLWSEEPSGDIALLVLPFEGSMRLTVNHQRINTLSTKNFNLTCMYEIKNTRVVSLQLAKMVKKGADEEREELVYMDNNSNINTPHPDPDANYKGEVQDQSKAYLSVTWNWVHAGLGGLYICNVNIIDNTGHINNLKRQVNVEEENVTFANSVAATKELQMTVDKLQTSLHKMQTSLHKVQTWKEWITLAFNLEQVMKTATYSGVYKNQYYIAYTDGPGIVKENNGVCEARGGYLAELNDFNEWRFVQSFLESLKSKPLHRNFYFVSGRWTGYDNLFYWPRQGKNLPTYFNWAPYEPYIPKNYPCVLLDESKQWKAATMPCHPIATKVGFVCEMPQIY